MKKNYNLFKKLYKGSSFISIKFYLLFILFSICFSAQAHTWVEGNFTITYDQCNGTATITLLSYFEDCFICYNDYLEHAKYFYKDANGNFVQFASTGYNNSCDKGADGFGGHSVTSTHSGSCSNSRYINAKINDLPSSVLNLGQIELKVVGEAGDDATPDTKLNWKKTVIIPSIPTPTGLTATSDNCSGIILNWTNPTSIPVCLIPKSKIEIWKNGSYFVTRNLISTYTDNTALPGVANNYQVKLIYDYTNRKKESPLSSQSTGTRKNVPTFPSNLLGSQANCDGTIELTWDWSGLNPLNFEVYQNGVAITPLLDGSLRNLIINVTRGLNYNYTIRARNDCGWGAQSPSVSGISPADPSKPADLNITVVGEIHAQLSWPASSNTSAYQIERSLQGGGGSSFFDLTATDFSYLDQSLVQCQTYEYRLRAFNDCTPNGVLSDSIITVRITPDISNTFNDSSLLASKGYFPGRIELSWSLDNNANYINQFKIYRKVQGSSDDSIIIQTLNSGSNIYNDFVATAGVLYQYTIVAEMLCEQNTLYSNTSSSIGFRSPIGTVSGQINYTGGIAVKDVRVVAENSFGAQGASLMLDGSQSLQIKNNTNLNISNSLSLEMWFRPTSHSSSFTLVEKEKSFSIKHVGSNYEFTVFTSSTDSQIISIIDTNIALNNFNHLSGILYNDTLRLYLNGNSTSYILLGSSVNVNTNHINFGTSYSGIIDEFRLWNIGKSSSTLFQDYSRQLHGGESGLKIYLRLDEGLGNYAYDFSKNGLTNFNRNHAKFINAPTWSTDIPSQSQLAIAGYTNAQGNYILSAPYAGNGQTFVISPSYLTHNFNPSTRALFIGEGSSIHNNINFEDISSFTVQGDLFYKNTTCAVEGASLKIDGNLVVSAGAPLKTDASGSFSIQVPIGNHVITIEKDGHVMNVGRFPSTGTYDFQADKAGIHFKDSTLIKITGRVVGGLREAQHVPGLGKSKNNIGQAQIILKSQQGNGCFTDTILTDIVTGEYTTYAPPLKYTPTVTIPSNPTISFGVLDLLDLDDVPDIKTVFDTIGYDTLAQIYFIDSFSFQKKLDFIIRFNPIIKVLDYENDTLAFMGDKEYSYLTPSGDRAERDLVANPLPWSLFTKEEYNCWLQVYEVYHNLTTNTVDSVPTTDGTLSFNNNLAENPAQEVEMNKVNTLDSLKYLRYTFKTAFPNFTENTSNPVYSYTKAMQIYLTTGNGMVIQWAPNNYEGTGTLPSSDDGYFRGYILGTKSDGDQFLTTGPQVPDYVLRDPPGSNSFAAREVGTEKTTENSWAWNTGGTIASEDKIFVGASFSTGVGVSVKTDIKANVSAGLTATTKGGNSGTETVTITNTKEWATNSNNELPGKDSDIYIGKSQNVSFGISNTLKIVPDSLCSTINCIGSPFGGLSFANTPGLSIVPGGYATQFIYSENHIKNYLIPLLEDTRNALLQSNSKYSSNLSISNDNYGLNNDDPRIDPTIQELTSDEKISYLLKLPDSTYYQYDSLHTGVMTTKIFVKSGTQKAKWDKLKKISNPEYSVLTGLSYTYNAVTKQDSLTGDSVRWINNQIIHWENAIMLNEWEKVNIGDAGIKATLKERELSDLYDRYKPEIDAYITLHVLNGAATALVVASAIFPLPVGTGAAAFGIATGTGIAAAEVTEEFFRYQNLKEVINNKFDEQNANYSISGGNSFSSSMTHSTASSYTKSIEYGISESLSLDIEASVNGIGLGFKKSASLDFTSSKDWSTTTSSTETVSFTLDEPDQGDYFSVDVFPSLLGWGPIFKLQAGGQTQCPHEEALITEYYQEDPNNLDANNSNSPFYEISARTLQREKPTITGLPSIVTNVPITSSAVFNLTINNESEVNDNKTYKVAMVSASNPNGAIVKIDGISPFVDVTIPGGSSINKVLTISKGPGPTYDYDSILIIVHSPCQYEAGTSDNVDIVDSVYLSAHFLPTCTDVSFSIPNDDWVLNNSLNDIMPIAIIDYDINFFDFNSIRLDYKASSQSQWIGLKSFYKDTTGLVDELPIPTSTAFTLWNWETDQIVDGDYDLRLVTKCTLADVISTTHSGVMDRVNPHPFGTPSPADGILDPNDDIQIKFNESIDFGSLTSLNFDVRGVLNGSQTTHYSNLYFDGVDDKVSITAGIPVQNRDFTLEFSVKRIGTGQEVILSQGTDANEQIYVGFNAANQLEFKINGQTVNSTNSYTDNNWHYFTVAYSFANETAVMFEASGTSTAAIINSGSTAIYEKYNGSSALNIGYSSVNSSYFNGNIDDVRVWNTTRTLSEFSVNKTIMLGSNEAGLLYNWRFDEADGAFAGDHVRSRNGDIIGAEWTIEPSGNAVDFDGVDDYLRIDKGDVNITKGMDFTLEFWFNSSQSGVATLVSNGSGSGLLVDSLYSWNIAKDAAGKIHVYHNGNDFVAVDNNYFDGEWHHFALVLSRIGNISAYVDGNLQNSEQAIAYKELGGSGMYLGARGYYVGITETFDSYYDGKIDEFRFWNASRKYEQIARDKQNRMKGDEFALKLYLPFENYQLDATGIPLLTASFDEQIDNANHTVLNPNGATLVTNTPKIKLQRPVESIAFTYSVNNDEIIITPTTSSEILENVTLDITVEGIRDLHGNTMESPKTWIAYIDKNQVVWQDDVFTYEKTFGDNLQINTAIVNNGGSVKAFTIENVPSWLTISPISGTVLPNSTESVTIEVDPYMNIGDYSQDIQLLTDFGYPEQMTINLEVRENEPNWTVDPANFTNSMSIIGYLKVNDVVSANNEDMLSVFVDGYCRGVAHLQYISLLDRYLVFLDVYSNVNNGENLEFRIWDASTGTVFSEITPDSLTFVANDLIGTVNAPQLFETSYEIAIEIPLTSGWNWISDFLINPDSLDLDITLESVNAVTGDEIKSQSQFSNYLENTGWVGSLNTTGIKPELGYKMKVTQVDTFVIKGNVIDPITRPISLLEGWNWIGFISIRNQNVSDALANLNPTDGDIIKAKSQFAVYNTLLGWVGSLQALTPGQAFMYYANNASTFVYPSIGQFKFGIINSTKVYKSKQWTVEQGAFASNMTMVAGLDTDCEAVINHKNLVLGVFTNENECRAVNTVNSFGDQQISFLTIGGNNTQDLSFGLLDAKTGFTYNLSEEFTYSSNKHIGKVDEPFMLTISDKMCLRMTIETEIDEELVEELLEEGGIETSNELFQVYPTVFEDEIKLFYFSNNENKSIELALFNVWGQKMFEKTVVQQDGLNKQTIDFSKLHLTKGVYHFKLRSGSEMHSTKLIKD